MSFPIFTAYPRGYCAGVHRAIRMLQEVLDTFPLPVYVNHAIIHNRFVVSRFEAKGVIFEPDIECIPEGSLVVISAHGTGPSYFKRLRDRHMRWIDATCPLVEKVHTEARTAINQGHHILYIGKSGHQEAIGILDEGGHHSTLIEDISDIARIAGNPNVTPETQFSILTQTTLSIDETEYIIEAIVRAYPNATLPKTSDICYATTHRQKAVRVLAEQCDLVFVVGSKNSSNSSQLQRIAASLGKSSYLIDGPEDIDPRVLYGISSVGVTAGASGPEELIEGVIVHLAQFGGIFKTELRVVEETVEFPYSLKIQS